MFLRVFVSGTRRRILDANGQFFRFQLLSLSVSVPALSLAFLTATRLLQGLKNAGNPSIGRCTS